MTCAVISKKIDRVNEFAVFFATIISERDFKNEKLLRMCFVATNLVISLEFNPNRHAATMCHFGRTSNGSVATQFILHSSSAENSAKSEYISLPERIGQNEEPVS